MSDFSGNKMASTALVPRSPNFISGRKKLPSGRLALHVVRKINLRDVVDFLLCSPRLLLRIKRATGGIYGLVNIFGHTLPLLRSANLVCSFNLPTSRTVLDSVQRTIRRVFGRWLHFVSILLVFASIRCNV
ncbi:hypothetical protein CEXT_136911 [Caerostris extrusa]|uniref:Uncharacterized protein n=1 Tax=Caerostris extrusa TaxID=172846 RepID=A0AAV4U7M1_CAEEX|nr:hypothetical protein CEXT_136911 [Caerostris extrusa]